MTDKRAAHGGKRKPAPDRPNHRRVVGVPLDDQEYSELQRRSEAEDRPMAVILRAVLRKHFGMASYLDSPVGT